MGRLFRRLVQERRSRLHPVIDALPPAGPWIPPPRVGQAALSRRMVTQSLIAALFSRAIVVNAGGQLSSGVPPAPDDGYDVRRAGAVGDGTTDDTDALREACKSAGVLGSVLLPAEMICLVTGSIIDSSLASHAIGQTWHGGGKVITPSGCNFDVFDCRGVTDVTVRGLRAECGRLAATYSSATARFMAAKSGGHRCSLVSCHVTGFQSAVQFHDSAGCRAIGNTIESPVGWGVNVQTGADDALVYDNQVTGTAAATIVGITRANPAVFTTSDPHGYSTGDQVIVRDVVGMSEINGKTSVITVLTATTFQMNSVDSGSYVAYARGGSVRNKLLEHGIYVAGSRGNNIRVPIIERNRVTLCGTDGIKTSYCDDGRLAGNAVWENGGQGIHLAMGTNRADVVANESWSNLENGILVYDGSTSSDSNRVRDNIARGNGKSGISVRSTGTGAVTRVRVHGNAVDGGDQEARESKYGIVLTGANTTEAQVSRNKVSHEVTGVAIGSDVVAAVVEGNEFTGCTTDVADRGVRTSIRK